MKHGAVFAIQNGSSVSSDAKTVTSLLTLLSLLDVALLLLLIGISIFKLSTGTVSKAQILFIFCWGKRFFPVEVMLSKPENVIFYHFFTPGHSYPMKEFMRLSL